MKKNVSSVLFGALLLSATAFTAQAAGGKADAIYFGGDILTMATTDPSYAEALAVEGGKIAFTGSRDEALKLKGDATKLIDLKGRTLLPGFIDTHGHMVYFGKNMIDADLFGTTEMTEVITRMKAQVDKTPDGAWIVGFGYMARKLKEGRHPTVEELDLVSADRPVASQKAPPGHGVCALRPVWGQIEPLGHAIGAETEAGQ